VIEITLARMSTLLTSMRFYNFLELTSIECIILRVRGITFLTMITLLEKMFMVFYYLLDYLLLLL